MKKIKTDKKAPFAKVVQKHLSSELMRLKMKSIMKIY